MLNFRKHPSKYDFEKYFRKHLNQHHFEKYFRKSYKQCALMTHSYILAIFYR